ncbi:T9SS type A sorting domain-containing protein [Winogradskyella sp. F6397]|uniref:T9SS type A sorting domain-containing protein n=1 Tax=Winogradskyella marina TaxID=2785530 RepID=A0ABS0EFT2_9FLAO|nr:T9SS type A sorting domain-containing protein [Winogradskyella marina]MBF8149041.1 T9SS type A sorting domain-containing protein [Winogradskyella marina]
MKNLLFLLFLIPFINFGQVQIGEDIQSEDHNQSLSDTVSLSADGSILAIGSPGNHDNGFHAGHVRIYENIEGIWTQIGTDIEGDAGWDMFGTSISLSSDGTIVAIGAHGNDSNGEGSGHVKVYENIGGVWIQVGQDIEGSSWYERFGKSVSLSSDGTILAIGAPEYGSTDYGLVRVYKIIENVWTLVGNIILGENQDDNFGKSVSLSSDGSVLAIGATGNSYYGNYSSYVKVYENIGDVWTQIGSNINGEANYDESGSSVRLSADGSIVAIAATKNDGNGSNSGHVRIFKNIGDIWTQVGVDIDGEAVDDQLGSSISLSSDGSILAVGAPAIDGSNSNLGKIRIYKNIEDVWIQIGTDIYEDVPNYFVGSAVSLSSDGSILAINIRRYPASYSYVRVYDISESALSTQNNILESFKIYPNPTKNQFTIQLNNTTELKNVTIYNNLGQQVLTSKKSVVDTSKLASGLYVVEIDTNKGKASKKLIIE